MVSGIPHAPTLADVDSAFRETFMPIHTADDLTVWWQFPEYHWMYNRLDLALALGYDCAPSGIWPTRFPVVQRPIINLYGMGIGAELVFTKLDYRFRAGAFWCEMFMGPWYSLDLDRETGLAFSAVAVDGPWTAPSRWHVEGPHALLADIFDDLRKWADGRPMPQRINIEVIGELSGNPRIIEVHPRWTAEFVPYYDGWCPFTCEVAWSESLEDAPPEGYVDTRLCDTNYLRLAEGKPARIGIRITT